MDSETLLPTTLSKRNTQRCMNQKRDEFKNEDSLKKLKEQSHVRISINAKNTLDKIQHSFIIKTSSKLEIGENYLNLIKDISQYLANITLNGGKYV